MTGIVGISATTASAQGGISSSVDLLGQRNVITTAVPFLTITPDARAAGMGDLGVATSPDANGVHWNPGKMAFIDGDGGISLGAAPWLRSLVPDVWFYYLSGYSKVGDKKRGTVAGSLRYFSLGNIEFTDENGNPQGSDEPKEFSIDLSYSLQLSKKLSFGISTRYINSRLVSKRVFNGIDIRPGQAVSGDLGAYYKDKIDINKREWKWAVGMAITNMGNKITYTTDNNRDFIPINLRVGTFWETEIDEHNKIGFGIDFNKLLVPSPQPQYVQNSAGQDSIFPDGSKQIETWYTPDDPVIAGMIKSLGDAPGGFREEMKEFMTSVGMEYWYEDQFAVRAGYFHEAPTKGARKYMTLGVGVRYNVFGLDVSFLKPFKQRHPLENTLRFTLLFDMEAFTKQNSSSSSSRS
ncbi:MAG: type IX secretion system outer membrane channel protein PorV [Flavobacteriales bacterium]|nr:type IX secretion system outer membrane channel protein PorV [Bacteroidota bacterium]MCB9241873.1 type IX secretion system outer membrane channel protein PorV [Flavobacteriales bacterium]